MKNINHAGPYAAYDTETSGLPIWGSPSDHPDQPHIVQLGIILVDSSGQDIDLTDVVVKPDGWEIPKEVSDIHGITTEMALDMGIPEIDAVTMMLDAWRSAEFKLAHNTTFDNRIIRIALKRYFDEELMNEWTNSPYKCTGHLTKGILKMPAPRKARRYGPYKMPKLEEAYKFFFDEDLEGAHTAMADAQACKKIYQKLLSDYPEEAKTTWPKEKKKAS